MTLNCGHPLDALGFAVERAKQLGLTVDQMTNPDFREHFGCDGGVLMIRQRPGKPPDWTVVTPNFSAAKAIDFLLTISPGGPS